MGVFFQNVLTCMRSIVPFYVVFVAGHDVIIQVAFRLLRHIFRLPLPTTVLVS